MVTVSLSYSSTICLKTFTYITGFELLGILNLDGDCFALILFYDLLETYLLKVKDNVGNIFLNAWNGSEFMLDTLYLDGIDGKTLKSREKDTTKSPPL